MPYSISDRVQSLPERILPGAAGGGVLGRMDPVLFVRPTAQFQLMVVERVEVVRGFQSFSQSWLWSPRGIRFLGLVVAAGVQAFFFSTVIGLVVVCAVSVAGEL